MRLCIASVVATGILLTCIGGMGAYKVAYNDSIRLGENISVSTAASLEGEYEYLLESISY